MATAVKESRGVRRSTRAHPSHVQDDLSVKTKPGYVFVPVDEDQASSSDIFDLPPRRLGSRVGMASRAPTALESISESRSTPADACQAITKVSSLA